MPTTRRTTLRLAALLAAFALPIPSRADDPKTQEIDAGGLKFTTPAAWKAKAPESEMRRAQLTIEPAGGDKAGAELVVFAFPGDAGGVDANVERWKRTFKDEKGDPPKVDVKTVKGKNTDLTRVEMAGHYTPTTFPGQPKQEEKDNYRLLGAIVLTGGNSYFVRLVGPEKTVNGARDDFDKALASMEVVKK